MPHQCTACGHVFEDGSKEMLSGCPGCGGNKFQFHPSGAAPDPTDVPDAEPPPADDPGSGLANTVGRATETVRDWVGGDTTPDDGDGRSAPEARESDDVTMTGTADETSAAPTDDDGVTIGDDATESSTAASAEGDELRDADSVSGTDPEDSAQADARSGVVSPEELSAAETADPPPSGAANGTVASEPSGEQPDLADLRAELNDQFESIKILEPGQYELNLMELYNREETIIALQENGRYVIEAPEGWMDSPRE